MDPGPRSDVVVVRPSDEPRTTYMEGRSYAEPHHDFFPWRIDWSAVFAGTLAALATALALGLIGTALGAQYFAPGYRVTDWHKFSLLALIFGVVGSFFSFVVGGWVAAKVAGWRREEPAMLHGALSFLVSVPLILALTALGAGSSFGGFYYNWGGTPNWANNGYVTNANSGAPVTTPATNVPANGTAAAPAPATPRPNTPITVNPDDAAAARNGALGALTGLLLGLVGSVLGGWMASGRPMTFYAYRTRPAHTTTGERVTDAGEYRHTA